MNILITGATGFIGRALTVHLTNLGHQVTALVRHPVDMPGVHTIAIDDITHIRAEHAEGQDLVFHLAGVAHDNAADRDLYRKVNVNGTQAVTRACLQTDVKRLVYLSSIKVHGESSTTPLHAGSPLRPADDYGHTKLEAEQVVLAQHLLDPIVVRIPLVYGPGVKGNFAALIKLANTGLPLPFKSMTARRSYLGLDNLLDLLTLCIELAPKGSEILYGSDPESLTLPELLTAIGNAMQQPVRLIALPQPLVATLTGLVVGTRRAGKLFNPMEIDLSGTTRLTGWAPSLTTEEVLHRMFGHPAQPC